MKNKKCIYERVTVYDPRKIFFVCSAVDGHIISEEARTLREAIDEAQKLYSESGFHDGTLEIRTKCKDYCKFAFIASIQRLRDIEENGHVPAWRWIDKNVDSISEIVTLRDTRPMFSVVFSQNGDHLYEGTSTLRGAVDAAKNAHDTTNDDDDDDSLTIIVADEYGWLDGIIDASPNDLREIERRGYVVVRRWI